MSNESTEQTALPELALSADTIQFLSRVLLGGGPSNPSFTNGRSLKISDMLASGTAGFFDKKVYPETSAPSA